MHLIIVMLYSIVGLGWTLLQKNCTNWGRCLKYWSRKIFLARNLARCLISQHCERLERFLVSALRDGLSRISQNGVEGTVTCYRYSVTVTGYSYTVTGYSYTVTGYSYTVSGYSYTVTGYSSLPLKNCLTMAISVAPLR